MQLCDNSRIQNKTIGSLFFYKKPKKFLKCDFDLRNSEKFLNF